MNILKAVNTKNVFLFITFHLLLVNFAFSQNPVNWTKEQLMQPLHLAEALQANTQVPVIISVGPGAVIPHSVAIGPAQEAANLDKMKTELNGINKDSAVVVYCGCCPFERCPNVRPAIALLKEMEFTNYKLLNLTNNVKTDWLDKGYPAIK